MVGAAFLLEETVPEGGGWGRCYGPHFFYLQFVFYYLEEVMDHKILILPPPHFGSQYEIYKSEVTFQNILGFAGH